MSTDTKALVAATPATVALVRRELDRSRESQRGMQCGIPKAVKVDCAMVERLCRIAEKQADRLAALEAENSRLQAGIQLYKADFEHGLNGLKHEYAKLEQDNARLRAEALELQRVQSDVLANLDAPDDMDVISAAHFVAGSLSTAEEALEAAQAEARELRAELARVSARADRYGATLRVILKRGHDHISTSRLQMLAQWNYRNASEVVQMLEADRDALSQPAEQHDPLAVSDHCPECSEPEPECVCGEQPAERESLPLTPAPQPEEAEP